MSRYAISVVASLIAATTYAQSSYAVRQERLASAHASRLQKEAQIESAWIYGGAIVIAAIIIGICILIAGRRKHQPG